MLFSRNKICAFLKHILIGGRPCTGKTTVDLKLARKISGFQDSNDTNTFVLSFAE